LHKRGGHVFLGALAAGVLACAWTAASATADKPPGSSYVANPPDLVIGPLPAGRIDAEPPAQCHPGFYCYSPQNMREVYNIPSGSGADGAGQTIVLVEAFGSRTIEDDLASFDGLFGLPAPPSFTVLGRNGTGRQDDPNVFSWIVETSIDVEWAHAIAPGANIVLAVARSDNSHRINDVLERAVAQYPGAIVSQSFGSDETFVRRGLIDDGTGHRIYAAAAALGDTVLAGAGDFGASGNEGAAIVASYPASDPFVTGVGGTEGLPAPNGLWSDGHYGGEQVWNETSPFQAATGGAPSQIFPSPAYQAGLGFSKRATPDVSYNASVAAGFMTVVQQQLGVSGGTSAGAPQWAGIFAIANEQRAAAGEGPLGPANPALYAVYGSGRYADDFHDITVGDNVFDPDIGGFSATLGYDLASGIGTPNVGNLLADLLAAPGTPPAVRAPDVDCQNATLDGVYHDVTVPRGYSCTLAGATVLGDLRGNRATSLSVQGTTVLGKLDVSNTNGAPSSICNSAVFGSVRIDGSGTSSPWSIGGATCAGSPDVTGSVGSVFGRDFHFSGNAAATNEVSDNTVGDDMECNRNGGVTGSGNLAGGDVRGGQCTADPLPG
jgi:hypothetical protein